MIINENMIYIYEIKSKNICNSFLFKHFLYIYAQLFIWNIKPNE